MTRVIHASDAIQQYLAELRAWAPRTHLVGSTDPEALDRHVSDSLAARDHLPPNARVVDLGSGAGFPGIGGHVCLSLRDRRSGRNHFADAAGPHGLSQAAQSFLAGIVDVIPEAFPMCAHTVNAYRRFAPGSWAPKTVSWAPYNYAAAIRTAAETEEMTRLELRLPGSDVNVHLALALMLGAGLDGLERGLALTDEPIGTGGPNEIPAHAPRLPSDLREATQRFRTSEKAKRLFGAAFVEHFAMLCDAEDAALRRAVNAAEVQRYLEGG